jgi:hypothetical protein
MGDLNKPSLAPSGDIGGEWDGPIPLRIPTVNVVLTLAFVAVAIVATLLRTNDAGKVLVIVSSLVLFAIGIFTCLWAYVAALERSRSDEIGVANLFLLTGPRTAPALVRLTMWGSWAVQIVTSVIVASVGASALGDDDSNALAFAVLVPMLGIGLNGVWAVLHGRFGPRRAPRPSKP